MSGLLIKVLADATEGEDGVVASPRGGLGGETIGKDNARFVWIERMRIWLRDGMRQREERREREEESRL